jgi:CBS domain-containing protein
MIDIRIAPTKRSVDCVAGEPLRDACENLEAALAEMPVAEVQTYPLALVSPELSVRSAVSLMADRKIACLIVVEDGELRGVFTERDVLNKVAENWEEVSQQPVGEVMTDRPVFVYENDSAAAALCVMAAMGYRHVPVVNEEKQVVGVVSPRRALHFVQQHLYS